MNRIRNRWSILPLLFALAVGCGDDEATPGVDARVDTPDASLPEPDAMPADSCTCVALGVDYMAGVGTLATISLPDRTVSQNRAPGAISGDPVVRRGADGRIYVVNRFGADNVTILDPQSFDVIAQFSTGAGSNPQDVAVVGQKLYVAALALRSVQVYDATDLAAAPTPIDLSSYDPDGTPDPNSIFALGTDVYVTLGRLDSSFLPTDKGLVVRIDSSTDTVSTTFELQNENPIGFLRAHENDSLFVSTAEDFSGTRGCLEWIQSPAASCFADNVDLGGTVNAIAAGDGDVYLAVTGFDAMFNPFGKLLRLTGVGEPFEPAGLVPSTQVVNDVALCAATGQLVYTDGATGGVRVYDLAAGAEVTTAPLDIGLPPAYSGGLVCY